MARHLSESDARLALRQGRAIEQFLGAREDEGDRLLRWVRCHTEPNGTRVVSVFEVFDERRPDFTDLVEFSSFDPDEPSGTSQSFDTPDEAWAHLTRTVRAAPERFVGSGMAAEEYADFVARGGGGPAIESLTECGDAFVTPSVEDPSLFSGRDRRGSSMNAPDHIMAGNAGAWGQVHFLRKGCVS